jgi:FkbM family methyltransferase
MNNNLIYDIGFNCGDDTAYYLYRGYNVVGIDANPFLIAEGVKRFTKEIKEGRLTLLNYGVSNTPGLFPIWINTLCDQWSSITGDMGKRNDVNAYPVNVNCVTAPYLLSLFGVPLYMKIDIEGGDADVLKGMIDDPFMKPKYISVESHAEECIDQLLRIGYNSFKMVAQANIARQNYFDWTFTSASSGRLPWESEEPWMTGDELRTAYLTRDMNNWFDIYAKTI